jgi:ATP-dependent DNA ligase
MKYEGIYIYPPRPEMKASGGEISRYDNGDYIAQPKYNGDCVILTRRNGKWSIFNRHKEPYTKCAQIPDMDPLLPRGDFVLAGEYLSKNKTGEHGPMNNVIILWDVLVWDGLWLINSTVESRLNLLETIPASRSVVGPGGMEQYDHVLVTAQPRIYRAPAYISGFAQLYADIIKTDLYEGLVLKRRQGRLTPGLVEKNNTSWQLKFRKPSANYNF